MTDCIGYIIAKRLGMKFLTGDKEFEGFENVEFVKQSFKHFFQLQCHAMHSSSSSAQAF